MICDAQKFYYRIQAAAKNAAACCMLVGCINHAVAIILNIDRHLRLFQFIYDSELVIQCLFEPGYVLQCVVDLFVRAEYRFEVVGAGDYFLQLLTLRVQDVRQRAL